MEQTIADARKKGWVQTLLGRRRRLGDINARRRAPRAYAERMARNTPIQGTAADLMKLAMLRVDEALERAGSAARILLQVHDELLLEVPRDAVDETGELVRDAIEGVHPLAVPLTVDQTSGASWLEAT